MKIKRKVLNATLTELSIKVENLCVGNIVKYPECNTSGSPIGTPTIEKSQLLIKIITSKNAKKYRYGKLEDILSNNYNTYPLSYESYCENIVVDNIQPLDIELPKNASVSDLTKAFKRKYTEITR